MTVVFVVRPDGPQTLENKHFEGGPPAFRRGLGHNNAAIGAVPVFCLKRMTQGGSPPGRRQIGAHERQGPPALSDASLMYWARSLKREGTWCSDALQAAPF